VPFSGWFEGLVELDERQVALSAVLGQSGIQAQDGVRREFKIEALPLTELDDRPIVEMARALKNQLLEGASRMLVKIPS
jgi:hypothetical protein